MRSGQLSLFPGTDAPTLRDVADTVRQCGLDGLPDAIRRADQARYVDVHVRSALGSTTGMSFRWTLNPYRGCTHACEYCYARKYQRHLELGAGDDFSSVIFVKRNLVEVLRREVNQSSWAHEGVAVGTATDPYQPIEGHTRLTRRALEVLIDAQTPFSIVTKGPLVQRDVDLLRRASAGAGCRVYMSVPSVDDGLCARLEPGVASPAQRLRALNFVQDAGVETAVLMMPHVPGLTTGRAGVDRTVHAIAAAGLRLGGADVARLDPGVREHFFGFLGRSYPELVDAYRRLYAGHRAAAGYAAAVKRVVRTAAERAGLARPALRPPAASPSTPESEPRLTDGSRTAP
jgi:DNA repair photolyase